LLRPNELPFGCRERVAEAHALGLPQYCATDITIRDRLLMQCVCHANWSGCGFHSG
jgi:hypothetical protein